MQNHMPLFPSIPIVLLDNALAIGKLPGMIAFLPRQNIYLSRVGGSTYRC